MKIAAFKSACHLYHSTGTALTKVDSDIVRAADAGFVSSLGLLDLSASSNVVDRQILFKRLQKVPVLLAVLRTGSKGFSRTEPNWSTMIPQLSI